MSVGLLLQGKAVQQWAAGKSAFVQTLDGTISNFDLDSETTHYLGWAAPGTANGDAGWLIVRVTYNASGNPTTKRFAGGAAEFNQVWDNRAALSYPN